MRGRRMKAPFDDARSPQPSPANRGRRSSARRSDSRPNPAQRGGVRERSSPMTHLTLIAPAPFDSVSGGYEYDRRMVAGLRTAGHTVHVTELAGARPLPDAASRNAARTAWPD